jgi:predicted Zn-dependent protease
MRRYSRFFAVAVILLLSLTAPVTAQSSISREQELAVGRVAAARLITQYPLVVDADWLSFLGGLRDTLTPFSGRPDVPHQIIVVEWETPNAGSTPGYLFFTTGLIKLGLDRNGWAFIVAHELAHTAKRHVAAEIETARGAAVVGILVAVLTGSAIAGDLAELISRIGALGFSREREIEADELGMRMMTEAGFDSEKAVATLRFFNEATGGRQERTHWAGTHPGFADRVTRLESARQRSIEQGLPTSVRYYTREVQAGNVFARVIRFAEDRRSWTIEVEAQNRGQSAASMQNTATRLVLVDGQTLDVAFLRSTLGADLPAGGRIRGTLVFDRPTGVAAPASVVIPLLLPDGQIVLPLDGGSPFQPAPSAPALPRPPS